MKFMRLLRISVIVAATAVLATPDATAQQALEGCGNGCMYTVDGVCVPKRTTYGFHQTHWRKWPYAQESLGSAYKEPRRGTTKLPNAEVPRPTDESEVSPEVPGVETPDVPYEGNRMRPRQLEQDKQVDPFQDDNGLSPMDIEPGRIEELEDFPDTSYLRRRESSSVMNAGYRKPVREIRQGRQQHSATRSYLNPMNFTNPLRRAPQSMAQLPATHRPEISSPSAGFGRMEILSGYRLTDDFDQHPTVDNPLR